MYLTHRLFVALALGAVRIASAQAPQALITPDSAVFRLPLVARPTRDRIETAPPDVATRWWLLTWDEPARGYISPAFGGYGLAVSLPDSVASGQPLAARIRRARVAVYEEAGTGSVPGLDERPEPAAALRADASTLVLVLGHSPSLEHLWRVRPDSLRFFGKSPWSILLDPTWLHATYTR